MEHAHRHSLLIIALSLGEVTCVRPVRRSIDAIAQRLGLPRGDKTLRVGHMSTDWLREHEVDFDKHGSGR